MKRLVLAAVAVLAGCVGTGVKNEPGPAAPVVEKELAPLRVAVYVDKGARNIGAFRWLELTARAKNVVMTHGQAVGLCRLLPLLDKSRFLTYC